ncbi:MAG: undecaprenyldiphospho-muramoylpentapeptide beta-N-acetylglucosaminyltransferase [Candidatus Omnitrophica bacterium]|nr:undecaprenyldiphospho-muramoylpentapeptide beta-N-acetylglucosaminyltransferase [Candidatus Omnitrophota bacterium]
MKILATAGSSGGHIFPALSFVDAFKKKYPDSEALLVLPQRSKKSVKLGLGHQVRYICVSPVRLCLDYSNILAIGNLFKGSLESIIILAEFRPDAVVGFGGIESLPVVFFAWLFRVKTLLHEQNVMPGRANRLLAKFVDRVAVSFAQAKDYMGTDPEKVVLTGNPVRALAVVPKEKAREYFGLQGDKFTVLVMGGSQGSRHINSGAFRAISGLSESLQLQVIHLAGQGGAEFITARYRSLGIEARVFDFLESMEQAYSAADVAISRAGATTVTELILFNLPAILIPYPYAYQHQFANAKVLADRGCALVIRDEELDGEVLGQAINSVARNSQMLGSMRAQYRAFGRNNAAQLLVEEVESLNRH